jgi:hypothetical protein
MPPPASFSFTSPAISEQIHQKEIAAGGSLPPSKMMIANTKLHSCNAMVAREPH